MTNKSALYIVATPIGNLSDITLRAIETLKSVSLIAAEDTRHSSKLLQSHGIKTPLTSYHDHGGQAQVDKILAVLEKGESVALISDAGTPLISDPGYRLVCSCRDAGYEVVPIPGASALAAALCAAGLPSDRFCFEGFPPAKSGARVSAFSDLNDESRTLIFYESTHRVTDSLRDMASVFGGARRCCVARELTKSYETFLTGSLDEVVIKVMEDANQQRGEFVILLEGCAKARADEISSDSIRILKILLEELPVKQAAGLTAKITGEKKNKLYQLALSQKES